MTREQLEAKVRELETLVNDLGPRVRFLDMRDRQELADGREQIKQLIAVVERLTRDSR